MDSKQKLKWARRAIALVLVVLVVKVLWGVTLAGQPTSTTPEVPSPSSSMPTDNLEPPTVPEAAQVRAAVLAGQADLSLLPSLQFSPKRFVQQQVSKLAVAETQAALTSALVQGGQEIATQFMGYLSVDEAANRANYSELPKMYRVERINGDEAVISYFVESQWLDASGNEYHYPGITVVTLKLVAGKWLYVDATVNPSDMRPELVEGLTFEQTVARYQPFLEGFRNVYDVP